MGLTSEKLALSTFSMDVPFSRLNKCIRAILSVLTPLSTIVLISKEQHSYKYEDFHEVFLQKHTFLLVSSMQRGVLKTITTCVWVQHHGAIFGNLPLATVC